jgi:NAD(P)-dependent dehydrogenase (short-subunit alcohol dehydrogenase family)
VDLQLDEKVALATGASKGIGRHVAGHLAAKGTEVAITARTPGPLELTAREIQSATGRRVLVLAGNRRVPVLAKNRRVPVLAGDMSLTPDVASRVAATEDRPGPIGIPVICAGRPPGRDGAQRKAIMDR